MKKTYTLYEQVIDVTSDYLGPATKRFVDRQIIAHLDKEPAELSNVDLAKMNVWLEAVFSLLTNDKKLVSEYVSKLNKLSKESRQLR